MVRIKNMVWSPPHPEIQVHRRRYPLPISLGAICKGAVHHHLKTTDILLLNSCFTWATSPLSIRGRARSSPCITSLSPTLNSNCEAGLVEAEVKGAGKAVGAAEALESPIHLLILPNHLLSTCQSFLHLHCHPDIKV